MEYAVDHGVFRMLVMPISLLVFEGHVTLLLSFGLCLRVGYIYKEC